MKAIGAHYEGNDTCTFTVWAPLLEQLSVVFSPARECALKRDDQGFFHAVAGDVTPGTKYFYKSENQLKPDPASFFQPEGIFGASAVVDHAAFAWQDSHWKGIRLKDMIIYELHVGTFTPEGTFEAATGRLGDLVDLGITAVEVMPVAQFPGQRNWGYDGVFPFAVQNSYGGPQGLKAFVNACHQRGLAVILDVVYNHLGPEGNVLEKYMPVFTGKYHTPWGRAVNYDDARSDGIRNYFIQNARYWLRHYHIDALRLDAIQGIYDLGAKHFLKELAEAVEEFSAQAQRKFYLIAESNLNDRRIVLGSGQEGYGIDSQWSDDFHHAVHAQLTGESYGYYQDFSGVVPIARAMKDGFVYKGGYSRFRGRPHGSPSQDIPSEKFVVCVQNHDQVGNRPQSQRLSILASFEALKLAAGALITSPYLPLMFMGEEYGEEAPFHYFAGFGDEGLIEAVRQGRRREFAAFGWQEVPPDPFDTETFLRSKLHWDKRREGKHKVLLSFYKKLIELRKTFPALSNTDREGMDVKIQDEAIIVNRRWDDICVYIVMNFSRRQTTINAGDGFAVGEKIIDSCEEQWLGAGTLAPKRIMPGENLIVNPLSFTLFRHI
ncbi:MAG: malto-oligosyltrehalose trehalohydrolase [Candidatus Omnitrophica bacterium]|nr:malto-oligosyltrehalose trehalohydrolase [Candidatus Omnitrophota bacterium]MDE2009224.1 malto-oligosyltrehalose trehalohydrolase [Candidatus Omnitrophota bacterium]MDE2213745.1 malto-oligosyltrehalose trehalohydrolase [Candidatus Omnitrophota bacterium]MDE2230680.1 malto-oligosyltrehalose trehalohydrolase [Candidatus Omnitrophota bacterium]